MNEISNRLKILRDYLNLSQSKFGKKIGVGASSVGSWEIGIREIKPIHINAICNIFNINKEWLISGTGEMLIKDKTDNPTLSQLIKEYDLTELQGKILEDFLSLSSEQKDIVIEAMSIMSNSINKHTNNEIIQQRTKPDHKLTPAEKRRIVNAEIESEEKAKTFIASTGTNGI